MPTKHANRWSRARRTFGVLAATIAAVVLANVAVVSAELLDTEDPSGSGASAAVALASSAAVPADVDPVEGVVVEVPTRESVDTSIELPEPEDPPANPYAPTPEIHHGQLEIPAIGLSQPFFEGVTLTAINRGPSHWPGTALPGEVGNVVIAGHRTTYTKPFWSLNELTAGDELIFTVDGERHVYVFEELEIVYPSEVSVLDQTHERRATLFGCHPRGSARQRIVAHFRAKSTMAIEVFDTLGSAGPMTGL